METKKQDIRFSSHGDLVIDNEMATEEQLTALGLPSEDDPFAIGGIMTPWRRALNRDRVQPVSGEPDAFELLDAPRAARCCGECAWRCFPDGPGREGKCGHPDVPRDRETGETSAIWAADHACPRSVKDGVDFDGPRDCP